jgi:hypothetical protein
MRGTEMTMKTGAIKTLFQKGAIGICVLTLAMPGLAATHRIDGNLVLVPENKLPPQARVEGDAMTLHLVDLQTLYLYIERDHGRNLAIFDVRDPGKIKFKRLVPVNASSTFDFEGLASPHSILVRFRDGSGEAILDLTDAKNPHIRPMSETPVETSIVPVTDESLMAQTATPGDLTPRDYNIVIPNVQGPALTIKSVIQQANDVGNQTTYLLGAGGLTVVRNIRAERGLAAITQPWTNTIDDN